MESGSDNMPKISLLIPIYNVEKYLRRCLSSAVSQTLNDIEFICINDGSTDGSLDIIKDFAESDPRVKIIDKPNSGYGASMNRGLDEALGEYVGILESDDFFELDALETLYNAAKKVGADVAKADFYLYWSAPEERYERFGWVDADAPRETAPLDYPEVFYRKPSIWSALYRRGFLDANGIRFLETPGASYQDAGFNFKVWASAAKVVLIDKPILCYRQDNESSSVNSPGKVYCVCDEYAEMLRFIKGINDSHKQNRLRSILVRMRFDSYMWNYERLIEPLQLEFIDRMREDFLQEDRSGQLDQSLFDEEKLFNRELVEKHPDLFHLRKSGSHTRGKLQTVSSYYRAGGISYVLKMLKFM